MYLHFRDFGGEKGEQLKFTADIYGFIFNYARYSDTFGAYSEP